MRDRNFKLNFDLLERSLERKLNVLFKNRCLFDDSSCKKKKKEEKKNLYITYALRMYMYTNDLLNEITI